MSGRRALHTGAWWAAYVVAAWAGRQLVLPETGLALVWPAAGIGALWLALCPTRRERACAALLVAGSLYFLIVVEIGLPEAAWWSVAQLVQTVVAAELLRRTTRHARAAGLARFAPRSPRDLLGLGIAAMTAGALGALLGSLGVLDAGSPWSWWIPVSWTIRNGTGVFVVVALLASIAAARRGPERPQTGAETGAEQRDHAPGGPVELAAALAVTLAVTLAVFAPQAHVPVAFVVLPCVVWLGLRFTPATALGAAAAQGVLVVGLTLDGRGPFAFEADLAVRATTVQVFLLLACVLAMLLALSAADRRALLARATDLEVAAQERADMLDAVTHTMHDGLLVVDATGRAVLSNPAARDLLGPQAVGLDLGASSDVDGTLDVDGNPVSADDRPALRALRGETVEQMDLFRVDPETGAASVLSASAAPMTKGTGERLAVLVLSDVTEERARLAELKGFAGVVAHDLKGPIAGVRGWSEILEEQLDDVADTAVQQALRSTVDRMQGSAERAQGLIDDLLSYAQAGSSSLDKQPTTLAAVWEQALAQLPPTTGTGSEIRFVRGDDAIEVDVVLVRQLLVNLVGNSLKYVAPDVEPRVRISSRVVDDRLHVEVTDNGIGIPREEQAAVFDGFVRSSRSGSYPGTGLGLAICARAVQRHGGVIGARDAGPDGGTRISFTLPRPSSVRADAPVEGGGSAAAVAPVDPDPLPVVPLDERVTAMTRVA